MPQISYLLNCPFAANFLVYLIAPFAARLIVKIVSFFFKLAFELLRLFILMFNVINLEGGKSRHILEEFFPFFFFPYTFVPSGLCEKELKGMTFINFVIPKNQLNASYMFDFTLKVLIKAGLLITR